MHAESFMRRSRLLTIIITILALAGCGKGDGPIRIAGTPATPQDLPPGFCDPINFERACDPPTIINFNGGVTVIVDNVDDVTNPNNQVNLPDPTGINPSDRFARMQKFGDAAFGGTRLDPLEIPVDFSAGEAYKIKVWSERPVPVTFKLEETNNGTLGVAKVDTHNGGSAWEELCFDFTGQTVNTIGLTIIFDNGKLGAAQAGVFEGDWTFYYDDITQVESCVDTGPATGVIPDVKLYDPAGNPDLVIPDDYAEITPFGSGSDINTLYAQDETFSPVLSVFSGTGYGANIGQVGYIGFAAGFAGAYETLNFKVKGRQTEPLPGEPPPELTYMPNFVIFVKLFDGAGTLRINLTSSAFSEELDGGWFQVSIPLSSFSGIDQATGIVFESDDSAPMQFHMLLTDIGFGGTGTGGPSPPFDSGLLTNGDFEAGVDPWIGNAANVVDDGGNNVNSANVETAGNPFDVNLSQVVAITQGETYTLTFKARSDGTRTMLAGIGLNQDPFTNVTATVNLTAEWQTFEIEFTATDFGNANSRVLFDMGADTGLVLIDDVSLVVSTGGGGGAGDIAINGGFEAGDFSGWETFPGGGIQAITTDNPSSGTYAANLNVPVRSQTDPAVDNLIKNANLQAGNLTPGASVTVSFDMRGSLSGAGGVVFAEFFSELTGGGTSKAEIFSGGPLTPVTDWTPYSFTTTLGPDVSGGVTLQLKTSCGPVEGCGVDAYFDNVSIVIN